MEEELYDEFGNYIGPEIDAESERSEEDGENNEASEEEKMEVDEAEYFDPGREIVLHEDKQYYTTAEKVFGKDVQTLV